MPGFGDSVKFELRFVHLRVSIAMASAIRDVAVLVETNVTAAKSNLHVGACSAMLVVHSGDWSLSADSRFKSARLARLCFSLALGIVSLSNFRLRVSRQMRRSRGGKWDPRFHLGVFIGMLNSSSDAVIVT